MRYREKDSEIKNVCHRGRKWGYLNYGGSAGNRHIVAGDVNWWMYGYWTFYNWNPIINNYVAVSHNDSK